MTKFLWAEYSDAAFLWEPVELLRRLTLTGFVLLIPDDHVLLRLIIALMVATLFLAGTAPRRDEVARRRAFGRDVCLLPANLNEARTISFWGGGGIDSHTSTHSNASVHSCDRHFAALQAAHGIRHPLEVLRFTRPLSCSSSSAPYDHRLLPRPQHPRHCQRTLSQNVFPPPRQQGAPSPPSTQQHRRPLAL